MKKIALIILTVLLISSCSTLITRETRKQVMIVDFRPYSEAGFFLSPSEYPGEYTPVGLLNMVVDPAVMRYQTSDADDMYQGYFPEMVEQIMTSKDLINMAVQEATIRGSNGIANLKIEVETQEYMYKSSESLLGSVGQTMPVRRYIISGFLIRIMPTEKED